VAYDFDRLSKDDKIGQITIPFDNIDFGGLIDEWVRFVFCFTIKFSAEGKTSKIKNSDGLRCSR
jgi:hypothetical protein